MFAERFDALMNIAEVSNSMLGRKINMNPSHLGRLRSGARPLPKKHEFLPAICAYLAAHIRKDYQITALQKLTGIGSAAVSSPEGMALYLEHWILEPERDTDAATERLISGFSHPAPHPHPLSADDMPAQTPRKYSICYYGNAGKRKAVEQFFRMILQEKEPQTLLLFSDENMAWLYEDAAFAVRWADLFRQVLLKGNRVRVIHTVARNLSDLLEAITKWMPIYMTGAVEPYCYPRLRDGLFQRTMFIAPRTAAIVSSSVQQDTSGMLNLFLTDRAAIDALATEYQRYFALCRPLMRIYTQQNAADFRRACDALMDAEADVCHLSAVPPLFAMPEKAALELARETGDASILRLWRRDHDYFQRIMQKQRLFLTLPDPAMAMRAPDALRTMTMDDSALRAIPYTSAQYARHLDCLLRMEKQYDHFHVRFRGDIADNTLLCVVEHTGVIMTKTDAPMTAFVFSDPNMVNSFWDYLTI